MLTPEHLSAVDDTVSGRTGLPCESGGAGVSDDSAQTPDAHAFGALVAPLPRGSFALAPVMVTWRTCVMLVAGGSRTRHAFACVPGAQVQAFVAQLERGALDDAIQQYLATERLPRRLATLDQAAEPGLYDELGSRHELLPLERGPVAAIAAGRGH